jgi:DNA polymerase elongation subunit (family B)
LKAKKVRLKRLKLKLPTAMSRDVQLLKMEISALEAQIEALDSHQQALKILANSTSYGIFVEMIVGGFDPSSTVRFAK